MAATLLPLVMQPYPHSAGVPVSSPEQCRGTRGVDAMTVKTDNPGNTIRRQYRNPTRYIGSAWRGGRRRDFHIAEELWRENRACPLVTPLSMLRRA